MVRAAIVLLIGVLCVGCASPQRMAGTQAANSTGPAASQPAPAKLSDIAGKYRVERLLSSGSYTYDGEAYVVPRGAATYDLYVYRYRAEGSMGVGLLSDTVFGAGYWQKTSEVTGLGVVIYSIKGGTLSGPRLMESAIGGEAGEEILEGPADLNGKFTIKRSVNPYGADNYSGFAQISKRGDRYRVTWYTPQPAYTGIGFRIADKLVVAFSAESTAPGVLGYCVGPGGMTGAGAKGFSGGAQRLHLQRRTATTGTDALPPCAIVP
jgi:hypothetical protein